MQDIPSSTIFALSKPLSLTQLLYGLEELVRQILIIIENEIQFAITGFNCNPRAECPIEYIARSN